MASLPHLCQRSAPNYHHSSFSYLDHVVALASPSIPAMQFRRRYASRLILYQASRNASPYSEFIRFRFDATRSIPLETRAHRGFIYARGKKEWRRAFKSLLIAYTHCKNAQLILVLHKIEATSRPPVVSAARVHVHVRAHTRANFFYGQLLKTLKSTGGRGGRRFGCRGVLR